MGPASGLSGIYPVYPTVHHILTNPVYAGAYAFDRRTARVTIENGRKRVIRSMQRDWRSWEVLIRDHHEGYISWAEFERNQKLAADNANGKRFLGRGAVRPGEALLPGLLRCARCGKRLRVRYDHTYRYECVGAFNQLAAPRCITFDGMRVDRTLAKEVLDRLQPLGVEAALAAIEARGQRRSEKKDHLELALQQARYEAGRSVSMTPPIKRIAWWPVNWSDAGTSAWLPPAILNSRSIVATPTKRQP